MTERFNQTLKEQTVYGRLFRDLEEVRAAAGAFAELYSQEWPLEKDGYLSPWHARQAWLETSDLRAAD